MKIIKYKIMQEINVGTEEVPDIREELRSVVLGPMPDSAFDANYAMAQAEAHGEITVEDIPDPVTEPPLDERNRADIDYIALMTGIEL